MRLHLENNFSNNLPADLIETNETRQVVNACFSYVNPKIPSNPKLIHASNETAKLLGLSKEDTESDLFLNYFSGKELIPNSRPYSIN
jgi:uncharacterized protein YdiU (UPF0061 family)